MGNPRQRRKARSSAHKTVKHSRHAKRNLKKMKPIRGPKALQDAWDNKKTLRQNYAALGLVGSLKQCDSGGSECLSPGVIIQSLVEAGPSTRPTKGVEVKDDTIPQTFGKILRDADGNVTGIEIIENEQMDSDEGEDMTVVAHNGGRDGQREVVNALEKLAESAKPVQRFSSGGEVASLKQLITKHGHDFGAMAKDRRLNNWQRTSGQLERAIKKAGLV